MHILIPSLKRTENYEDDKANFIELLETISEGVITEHFKMELLMKNMDIVMDIICTVHNCVCAPADQLILPRPAESSVNKLLGELTEEFAAECVRTQVPCSCYLEGVYDALAAVFSMPNKFHAPFFTRFKQPISTLFCYRPYCARLAHYVVLHTHMLEAYMRVPEHELRAGESVLMTLLDYTHVPPVEELILRLFEKGSPYTALTPRVIALIFAYINTGDFQYLYIFRFMVQRIPTADATRSNTERTERTPGGCREAEYAETRELLMTNIFEYFLMAQKPSDIKCAFEIILVLLTTLSSSQIIRIFLNRINPTEDVHSIKNVYKLKLAFIVYRNGISVNESFIINNFFDFPDIIRVEIVDFLFSMLSSFENKTDSLMYLIRDSSVVDNLVRHAMNCWERDILLLVCTSDKAYCLQMYRFLRELRAVVARALARAPGNGDYLILATAVEEVFERADLLVVSKYLEDGLAAERVDLAVNSAVYEHLENSVTEANLRHTYMLMTSNLDVLPFMSDCLEKDGK